MRIAFLSELKEELISRYGSTLFKQVAEETPEASWIPTNDEDISKDFAHVRLCATDSQLLDLYTEIVSRLQALHRLQQGDEETDLEISDIESLKSDCWGHMKMKPK